MADVTRVSSVWAETLPGLDTLPKDKLDMLLQVCTTPETSSNAPISAADIVQHLLPLVTFLESCGSKAVEVAEPVVVHVVRGLEKAQQVWLAAQSSPLQAQQDVTQLLLGLRNVLQQPRMPEAAKQRLSGAVRSALEALLDAVLEQPQQQQLGGSAPATQQSDWHSSGCNLWLRALTRAPEFELQPLLPLLPVDAAALLRRLEARFSSDISGRDSNGGVPNGSSSSSAQLGMALAAAEASANGHGSAGPGLSSPASSVLARDDKLYLLAIKLIATASHASGRAGSVGASGRVVLDGSLMQSLLAWSTGRLRSSVRQLVALEGGAAEEVSLPPGDVTRAAARLAAACVSVLLEAAAAGASGVPADLHGAMWELMELVLAAAEALLSAAQRAPRALASDRLLLLAAAMVPHCATFTGALNHDAPEQHSQAGGTSVGDLARRLRALMLGSARLVTAMDPPARADAAAAAARPVSRQGDLSVHSGAALSGTGLPGAPSAAAAPATGVAGLDAQRPWAWDVTRSLLSHFWDAGGAAGGGHASISAEADGRGALLLCRVCTEVLCQVLVRAWANGQASPVHSLLVLPQALGSSQEQMASALALARLWAVSQGDGPLGRLLLPLLADGLTGGARSGATPEVACVLASALSGMAAVGALKSGESADALWAYEQALELLLKLYRAPTQLSLQLLARRAAHSATYGTLAQALHSLSHAATAAPRSLRTGLRLKLLSLFNDVGLAVGSDPGSGLVAADLGELLPALAAACSGLQPHLLRVLSHSASGMAVADINAAQRSDASVNRLFVSLWLHTALHRLTAPDAAGEAAAAKVPRAGVLAGAARSRWRAAAGRLAGVTPLLLVGPHCSQEADLVEALKVELGGQLAKAGRACANMGQHLAATVAHSSPLPPPTEPALLAYLYAVAVAELSRSALAPLPALGSDAGSSRNSNGGGQDDGDADADGAECPVAVTLGYLQGVLPEGVALTWVAAIAESACARYIARLRALQLAQEAGGADTPGATAAAIAGGGHAGAHSYDAAAASLHPALVYAEQLACVLIRHLGGQPGGSGQVGMRSLLETLAEKLLSQLLGAFPALNLSRAAYGALLCELQRQEQDAPLGQVAVTGGAGDGTVWRVLSSWVAAAAAIAPSATEALLHEFMLGSGRSASSELPHSSGFGGAVAAAAAAARAGGGAGDVRQGANAAALRRLVDLLRICGDARRRSDMGLMEASHEGTLSLTRKLYYAGLVDGLTRAAEQQQRQQQEDEQQQQQQLDGETKQQQKQTAAPSASDGQRQLAGGGAAAALSTAPSLSARRRGRAAVDEHVALQLEGALRQHARRSELDDAQLMATALLAARAREEESEGPMLCQGLGPVVVMEGAGGLPVLGELGERLLRSLCGVPLHSLSPGSMELAGASWAWVAAAAPSLLVPLVEKLVGAWMWSADQRLGLFAAPPHMPAGVDGAQQQEGQEQQGVEAWHDDAMLSAIAAHHGWLAHLLELWQVASRTGDARARAVVGLFRRLLHHSLRDPQLLSMHPAAAAARFRLLQLATMFACTMHARVQRAPAQAANSTATAGSKDVDTSLLFDKVLRAGLMWFTQPPRFFARCTRRQAREQHTAITQFVAQLDAVGANAWPTATPGGVTGQVHPVWGVSKPAVAGYVKLLRFLCREEVARLRVWADPLTHADVTAGIGQVPWKEYVQLAWQVHPQLALSLLDHFPSAPTAAHSTLASLVAAHATDPAIQALPSAAPLLATPAAAASDSPLLAALAVWAPGGAEQGLRLLAGPEGGNRAVRSYAMRCLFAEAPERVAFFLPQLVQLLRGDADGQVRAFFAASSARSDLFAHRLLWALSSEQRPPEEAFNPTGAKRSGWQPPKDTGLWAASATSRTHILSILSASQKQYWAAEDGYFSQVTGLSGMLYKVPKDERRAKLQEALTQFGPPRTNLYVPTNPNCTVLGHIPSSGACMQSAAKVPILVAFNTEERAQPGATPLPKKVACIFKVGDDIRQDVLAIQVISMLNDANRCAGLELYLRPYGCLPTGYECGIIEVVPHTRSRAALGELSDRGLSDIFAHEFGAPGSPGFERARHNFIVSEAAYAVASFLLQAKDRHNGNIMLDDAGHIVHIDFGFILEISPGGNMNFEAAAFKLSHEMAQLLDPGGTRSSAPFVLFQELVVRAYLAARTVAEPIIAAVALMADSGLPCFSRGAPLANLRRRFHLEMSDAQAAAWMLAAVADAYDNWRTVGYDYIQALQNKIPY